jgi:hypothetical protein
MEVKFLIEAWSAWSSSKPNRMDWEDWAAGCGARSVEDAKPDVSMVPAMKRRRMSSLSRMVFSTAVECLREKDVEPICVFATRHGELLRTVSIINSMAEGMHVSPTDFSLSVHNTALGLFSIFTDNKLPATTVVAGVDTFGVALIEAAVHLHRFPDRSVLLVFFDEPIPPPLDTLQVGPAEAGSIALLLSPSPNPNVVVTRKHIKEESCKRSGEEVNLSEDFLRFFLAGETKSEVETRNALWRWSRP